MTKISEAINKYMDTTVDGSNAVVLSAGKKDRSHKHSTQGMGVIQQYQLQMIHSAPYGINGVSHIVAAIN